MKHFTISPSIFISLFLGAIILPELFTVPSPISKVDAYPVLLNTTTITDKNRYLIDNQYQQEPKYQHEDGNINAHIECKMCSYVATKLNTTLFHNPKVLAFVTADIEKICNILPESVHIECNNAAANIAPIVLEQLGEFIADEGCQELGICPGH